MGRVNGGAEVPTLTVGNRKFTDLTNLIILRCAPTSAANRGTFREPNASSGYTPSGSKSFRVLSMVIENRTASDGAITALAQSDNDVGISSNTALTNPVYENGSAAVYNLLTYGVGQRATFDKNFVIANGKYLSADIQNASVNATITVYGYEE